MAAQADYNRLFGDLIGLEQRRKVLIDRASGAAVVARPAERPRMYIWRKGAVRYWRQGDKIGSPVTGA